LGVPTTAASNAMPDGSTPGLAHGAGRSVIAFVDTCLLLVECIGSVTEFAPSDEKLLLRPIGSALCTDNHETLL